MDKKYIRIMFIELLVIPIVLSIMGFIRITGKTIENSKYEYSIEICKNECQGYTIICRNNKIIDKRKIGNDIVKYDKRYNESPENICEELK